MGIITVWIAKAQKTKQKIGVHLLHSWLIIQSDNLSTFLPSSKILRSTTSSRKPQISQVFIDYFRNLSAAAETKNKTRNDILQTQLVIQTQPSGGPYGDIWNQKRWGEYRNGQKSTILFRHSIQTHVSGGFSARKVLMIPAHCVQQDRFPTCEHGIPSRPLGCYHPSGRESKTSTKRSARNSPPSLGMHDCLLWSDSDFKVEVLWALFRTDLGFF